MRRREFVRLGLSTAAAGWLPTTSWAAPTGARTVQATLPRNRVPLSFIIDDSTCLVNMGHFCMPQFAAAWPERPAYKKPWQSWPREIPDAFVREFGQWCAEHGVKGKYSIVPYPACVGWLDRELPGWSRSALQDSLRLVRELMVPNWDIHPEMITHTRVIDLKTGRPLEPANAATMENSYPQQPVSVDHLTEYLAYALRILRNCELPCEGITTPGGFGNRVKDALGLAAFEAVRDVYQVELPHYFKYVVSGDESTAPRLEHVRDLQTDDPRVVVNVPAGTGDWFGGWDGDQVVEGERYCNEDATAGRMVEMIHRREPAVMLCHWPGLFNHGQKTGLAAFQRVVTALASRFGDQTQWMKISEIARYWAAKELTEVSVEPTAVELRAPYACSQFTLEVQGEPLQQPALLHEAHAEPLRRVASESQLQPGTWCQGDSEAGAQLLCFDLPRGRSRIEMAADR